MSETVRVPLTVEKRAEIGDKLARLVERIKGVKAEAKTKAFAYREEIEALQEEQEQLSGQMLLGSEVKAQKELFADEAKAAEQLSKAESAKALHDVAAKACTCPEGPDGDVHSPACPVHGVDAQPAKVPLCGCGKPGSCIGHYDGDVTEGENVACDECCRHSQVDGHCKPLAPASEVPTASESTEPAGEPQSGEAAAEAPAGDESEVDLDAVFPREDVEAAVAANTVDVGTVEEPPSVAAHRAKRRRTRLSEGDGPEKAA